MRDFQKEADVLPSAWDPQKYAFELYGFGKGPISMYLKTEPVLASGKIKVLVLKKSFGIGFFAKPWSDIRRKGAVQTESDAFAGAGALVNPFPVTTG